jgi:ABC-type antimicrobial peptide transport system permease subunit
MDAIVARSFGQMRLRTWLLALFAGLAAGLAVVGIYGVVSYSVAQRTREMAVRMALGASPTVVLRLVIRHSLTLAATGVVLGAVGAFGAGRVLELMLFGVQSTDFLAFAIAGLGIGVVTVAATLIPARRATLVEPVAVLRDD